MKLKAAITDGTPQEVIDELSSKEFAHAFLVAVIGTVFKVDNPLDRPAEFYIQKPDITIQAHTTCGIEVRLTGVSRGTRPASVFHQALSALSVLVEQTVYESLPNGSGVQIFCVMMLDKEVETSPGSGVYSSVLESEPKMVTKGE